MDEAGPFTELVDKSFARMEHVMGRHSLRRLAGMEHRLEELERDLNMFLDGYVFLRDERNCTTEDQQPQVFY